MIMQKLQRENPQAQNVTKVRITAKDEQDAKKAAEALAAAGWKHHSIKRIVPADQLNKEQPDYIVCDQRGHSEYLQGRKDRTIHSARVPGHIHFAVCG